MLANQSSTPPEFQALLEALKAGLALIGALIGAYIGARMALSRFKRERAYDKRLEWHLAALRALHELESSYEAVDSQTAERTGDFVKAEKEFYRVMVESKAFMILPHAHYLQDAYNAHYKAQVRTSTLVADSSADADRIASSIRSEKGSVIRARDAVLAGLDLLMPNDLETRLGPVRYFVWIRARRVSEWWNKFREQRTRSGQQKETALKVIDRGGKPDGGRNHESQSATQQGSSNRQQISAEDDS